MGKNIFQSYLTILEWLMRSEGDKMLILWILSGFYIVKEPKERGKKKKNYGE